MLQSCDMPFIVRYFGIEKMDAEIWIVMEYCHCGSIGSYLRNGNQFTEDELREIASCCLLGMDYLHRRKIIHRDIKPDNLLISETGVIKLSDFGLAVQLNHSCSKNSMQCGTVLYMAPEVFDGKTVLKSDVWSLGISLMEMAEGKNPFDSMSLAEVTKTVCFGTAPALSSSKWSSSFVDFVGKCLKQNVDERPTTKELLNVPISWLNHA
ncbi:hypothetical protein WA577_006044 [Blastocystis sp. JDR]